MALSSALNVSYESDLTEVNHSSSSINEEYNASSRLAQPLHKTTTEVSKQEFEQLKSQATRLEHLLQVMPAGVVVINGRGQVKQANALAKALLGEPLEGQAWRKIIARSFKPQADDGHEVSLHDGRKVKLSITPLTAEPGQLIVLTDLTETRQLQQRISHMQRLSSLGKTVASIVHQIRTPLSAAVLYASNLASNQLSDAARERFGEKLMLRLKDLESQVNDMLLFAKSGEEQVVQNLCVAELMEELIQSSENMLQQSNTQLTLLEVDPAITILGNKPALLGALQNIIHNAIQVQPENCEITVSCLSENQKVILHIQDNGPGVDMDNANRIFEPFFTSKSHGTGLGLSVVATVAKSHGGSVTVTNMPGKGACFTIMLPIINSNKSKPALGDKS
ncbi:sensor histidine kinase [Aliiglaciecola lipolytica]|uniref:histidine kinase n=1 Tax=Aliiglaciecola lipolytica E3 TaxID=1127673 RepID=K6YF11_9ALTE|nr:ATP-binding protein [Aliiglaciecola lipolytica]GAC15223.1 two-component system, sensor histidine kinase FlrB [Aliiglaciecola lipolytica E3]